MNMLALECHFYARGTKTYLWKEVLSAERLLVEMLKMICGEMRLMDDVVKRKCVVCGAAIEGSEGSAVEECGCRHCGAIGRYRGKELIALDIPRYFPRLQELERRNKELTAEIYHEGLKGEARDMRHIQDKHQERQSILAEYSLLSYFRQFVDKW